ncbi:helix-turn-helix transcriptional regulator [Luteimonas sp. XNQY3]|nr:S24 family peptidase [Luteimonas sp. XNQY3]MCD9005186.1 helix-turn-helix transcriptional regulator [Luteimonas sp. XNQY3]
MDKYERRRMALLKLIAEIGHGGVSEISAKTGIDASYVSRLAYPAGKKGGKRLAEGSWDKIVSAFPQVSGEPAESVSRIAATETDSSDSFRIDLIAAEADMGDGRINEDFPEVIRAVEFPPDYIRAVVGFLPPPGRLVLVTGRGDSMIPVIQPGDSVIVDTGVSKYDGDGLYLINLGNGQQIKRLVDHGEDAGIYAHSDNKAYPELPLPRGAIVGGKVYLRARVDRFN